MSDEGVPVGWVAVIDQFNRRFDDLHGGLREMRDELVTIRTTTADIPVLAQRVGIQNGRVGKLEDRLDMIDRSRHEAALFEAHAEGERDGQRKLLRYVARAAAWVRRDGIVLKVGVALIVALQLAQSFGRSVIERLT